MQLLGSIKIMNIVKLFDQQEEPKNWIQALKWWEKRRFVYNLIIGVTGLFILFATNLSHEGVVFILPLTLLYGLCANIFYTFGWLTEIGLQKLLGQDEKIKKIGPILLLHGTIFSLMLNLLCGLFTVMFWVKSLPYIN